MFEQLFYTCRTFFFTVADFVDRLSYYQRNFALYNMMTEISITYPEVASPSTTSDIHVERYRQRLVQGHVKST